MVQLRAFFSADLSLCVTPFNHFYLHSGTFWDLSTCFNTTSILKLIACSALFDTFFIIVHTCSKPIFPKLLVNNKYDCETPII